MEDYTEVFNAALELLKEDSLKACSFAEEFRNEWRRVLRSAARNDVSYAPADSSAILPVTHSFQSPPFTFHFDQVKLWDWFEQDSRQKARRIFQRRECRRGLDNVISFHESPLLYDPALPEPALKEKKGPIFVCAMPGFPPPLQVVYGNKYVEGSFHGLSGRRLETWLVPAEFAPAFLCSSFEVCLYLYWMDCCIIRENGKKLTGAELRPLLHIFRDSSMLTVKELR